LARRGAEVLLAGHRPPWLISAGFAGALDPTFTRNDVFLATEVREPGHPPLAIDSYVSIESPSLRIRQGRLLTLDHIIRTAVEKAELRRSHEADAVDMESAAVAALCGERLVKFLAIRVISDDARTDLPAEVLSILGKTGSYRIGAALGAIWRRPSSIKDL